MLAMNLPRGIRNRNPGNIRWGDPWQGLLPADRRTDDDFCQFVSDTYGIRALAITLITYQDKYGIRTIRGIIRRWAPPSENNTDGYVRYVSLWSGKDADTTLDMHDFEDLLDIASGIIRMENGKGPLEEANTWYPEDVMEKALTLAGVERRARSSRSVPVTKETVGATGTGAVGAAQLAESLPQIAEALEKTSHSVPAGSIAQAVTGIALLAIAIVIAWSQVKRHRSGML